MRIYDQGKWRSAISAKRNIERVQSNLYAVTSFFVCLAGTAWIKGRRFILEKEKLSTLTAKGTFEKPRRFYKVNSRTASFTDPCAAVIESFQDLSVFHMNHFPPVIRPKMGLMHRLPNRVPAPIWSGDLGGKRCRMVLSLSDDVDELSTVGSLVGNFVNLYRVERHADAPAQHLHGHVSQPLVMH